MIRASDDGLSPLARLDAPRWYWSEGVGIDLEQCMPEHVVQGLIARCHDVVVAAGPTTFGRGQIVLRLPDGGYVAGSDWRADGASVGCLQTQKGPRHAARAFLFKEGIPIVTEWSRW